MNNIINWNVSLSLLIYLIKLCNQSKYIGRFDVAVLRLSKPVSYRANIVPICLPPPGEHFEGMVGIVAGWGKTDNSYGECSPTAFLF